MLGIKTAVTVVVLCAVLLALLLGYQYLAQKLGINSQSAAQTPVINEETLEMYRRLCEVFMECVRNHYNRFSLSRPCDIIEHILLPEEGIRVVNNQLFFVYQFNREITSSILSDKREYSTTPAEEIARMINTELRRYCTKCGAPQVKVYKTIEGTDGKLRFVVGEWR